MALNTSIRGLQIQDEFFGAGLARNGVDNNIMDVQVDDSTIEINADALRVKDDGITNDKLANIAQGSVKVGGASNAPTDLDAKTDGYILIGDGTDINSVAVSGDITITNAGVVTIGNDKVDNNKLANMTRGTVKVGGASDAPTDLDANDDGYILIGDGTDINSVAVSGDVAITNAGVTTVTDLTITNEAQGDLLYFDGANWVRLADGSADEVLTSDGAGGLSWTTKTATDAVANTDIKFENLSAEIDASGYSGEHTLASTPVANSVQVFLNGLLQEEGSGKDYTISGSTIQFVTEPESGDILLVHYITSS